MSRTRKLPVNRRRPAPAPAAAAWYEIRNSADDVAEVLIYDRIGESFFDDGVTAKGFVEALKGVTASQIHLRINSPGGSVFDGFAIYNALRRHPAQVTSYVDGMAASIASIIALAGDEVVMAENALFMIHDPSMLAMGTADDMRKAADLFDKVGGQLVDTYAERTGLDVDDIRDAMAAETWYTADEALDAGFIDQVGDRQDIAASFDLGAFGYRNYPAPGLAAAATHTPAAAPAPVENLTEGDTVDESTAVAEATAPTPAEPAFIPRARVQDPFPYRETVRDERGMHASFFRDMLNAKHDRDAAERFNVAQTMIQNAGVQTDVDEIIPTTYRPDMYVAQLTSLRTLIDSFSKQPIDGPNPIRVPKFSSASGLMADHVEGTNPSDGTFVTTEAVITPVAKSGKYTGSRELFEGATPAVDALIMAAIAEEYATETEAYAATTFLAGATAGTVVDISNGVTMQVVQRMITFQTTRKRAADVFRAGTTLFPELAIQVDTAGRPLNPYIGATNAPGTTGAKVLSLNVGGYETPLTSSLTDGLLGVSSDAVTFESGLRMWRWEEKSGPANIEIAAFGYIVCAVLRAAGLLKFATQA
jgi:ATP-dependent Clp endopeptidase proteolytic subunit ClpP